MRTGSKIQKGAQFPAWKALTPGSFKAWSGTSTLGMTWELVKNAGSNLLPQGGVWIRDPSPRKAARRPGPNLGRAPPQSVPQRCGAAAGARLQLIRRPHSTRPRQRQERAWWRQDNRGDPPPAVPASPGGQK